MTTLTMPLGCEFVAARSAWRVLWGAVGGAAYLLVICCTIEANNCIFPDMTVDAVIRKYGDGKLTAVWTYTGEKACMMGTRMLTREPWTKAVVHIKRAGGA